MKLTVNPAVDPEHWIACANRSFGRWGDRSLFDWCFRRDAGAGKADLLVYESAGRWVAGSAITYRCLIESDGSARRLTMAKRSDRKWSSSRVIW